MSTANIVSCLTFEGDKSHPKIRIFPLFVSDSSFIKQKRLSRYPNSESMPKKTMAKKKQNTQRLGQGRIARAFGKMLKLSSGPSKFNSSIF